MTYKISGTAITTQPTTGRWIPRASLGIDGNGHAIYPGVREYELKWQLVNVSDYNQLVTFFNSIGNTGTVVVDLPQFGAATYTFYSYSGCVLREPEANQYFVGTGQQEVLLLISNIRT
jgi:hypothetical protein